MGQFLNVDDLSSFVDDLDGNKTSSMIEDAEALAALAAPCLGTPADLTTVQAAGVKAVLRGAILRWLEAGSGAFQQQSNTMGPYGQSTTYDTRQQRRGMFWPSEITQLQDICGAKGSGTAFTVDTVATATAHTLSCSVNFGGFCSCGAVLSDGTPIYGA